jgi:hypothetical protein
MTSLFAMDNPVGCNQTVSQRGFAMVDMSDDRNVANPLGLLQQSVYHLIPGFLAKHSLKYFIASPKL